MIPPGTDAAAWGPTPSTRDAIIVGAGIGGLAAALALRQAGWNVRILERARAARELGLALLLAPNAMHALRPAMLRRYESRRMPRTRAVAQLARRNARIGSIRAGWASAARDWAIQRVPESVILKALIALGRPPA